MMLTKIWKIFYDYEKEENWLNEKAAKGLALVNYSFLCYSFEECLPGEYIYRLELLEKDLKTAESEQYLSFLKENNIELIASYRSWVYLRKKSSDGAFELFNDIDSRISHYQRISKLFLTVGMCEFCIIFSQIGGITKALQNQSRLWIVNATLMVLLLSLCIFFLRFWRYYVKKINQLKSERIIHE